jgi:hypothetical protein
MNLRRMLIAGAMQCIARQQAKSAIQQWGQAEVDFMVACQGNCPEIEGDSDVPNAKGLGEKRDFVVEAVEDKGPPPLVELYEGEIGDELTVLCGKTNNPKMFGH